ncbi:MAG TPA: protein-disulfide reductase DsbD domain-containing protein [Chthoniobacterales bacterium]
MMLPNSVKLCLRLFLIAMLMFLGTLSMAHAQIYKGKVLVTPKLVADTAAVEAGKPFRIGLLLKMAPGWHTYWKFPGDSGTPTRIQWTLPAGFTIGELQWPVPSKHTDLGDIDTYVYHDEVLLFATVTPPKELPAGPLKFRAKADWLVCEQLCVPGKSELNLELLVGAAGSGPDSPTFESFAKQIPATAPPSFETKWTATDQQVTLTIPNWKSDTEAAFFFPNPPLDAVIGHPKIEVKGADLVVTIPLFEGGTKPKMIPGVLKAGNQGWEIGQNEVSTISPPPSATPARAPQAFSIFTALAFGFLGGLILNLMPCVLPVISLKIFSFVRQSGESRQRVFRMGLAFSAGMFAWFLGLAVVLLVLRSTGIEITWAQQFQSPWFNIGISVLIFLFALNLFGVYEITLPGAATTKLAGTPHEGYAGAFFQGVFATILGTPCTAPYLGTTLAFALAQPPLVLLAVFAAIALGMSAPYLILCSNPAWMRFLPKPGPWMEHLKQCMGFLLLGTLLWFVWIVGRQAGTDAIVFLGALLLLSGLAAWIYGTFLTPVASDVTRAFGTGAFVGTLALLAVTTVFFRPPPAEKEAQNFAGKLEAALSTNRIVFVDFTADWCISCKVNKRVAINQPEVQTAFDGKNVLFLEADWTNGDPDITKILKQHGRAGVPLYLIFPVDRSIPPVVLPEILTPKIVLDALHQAEAQAITQNLNPPTDPS